MGNEKDQDIVYALDAKSGEVAWKHQYKCSFIEFNTGRVLWSPKGFGTGGIIMVDETLVILNEGGELERRGDSGMRRRGEGDADGSSRRDLNSKEEKIDRRSQPAMSPACGEPAEPSNGLRVTIKRE